MEFRPPYQLSPDMPSRGKQDLDRLSQTLSGIGDYASQYRQNSRQQQLQELQMQILKQDEDRKRSEANRKLIETTGEWGTPAPSSMTTPITGPMTMDQSMRSVLDPGSAGSPAPAGGSMVEKFRQWQQSRRQGAAVPDTSGMPRANVGYQEVLPSVPGYSPDQVRSVGGQGMMTLGTKRGEELRKLFPKADPPKTPDSLEAVLTQKVLSGEMTLEQAMEMKKKGAHKPTPDGKMLPANTVLALNEGKNVARMLPDVEKAIQANMGKYGPLTGRVATQNPYDEGAQTFDSQMRTASQAFGRFMEGGVLRREDEEKYRKMFPQASDTDQVKKNKLAIIRRLLGQKYNDDRNTLGGSGYDVSGFEELAIQPSIFEQSYGTAEDVRAAFKAGKLDEATATQILQSQFGYH